MDFKYFIQCKTPIDKEWATYAGSPYTLLEAIEMGWTSYFTELITGTRIVGMNSLKVVAEFYPNWDVRVIPEFEYLIDIEAAKKKHVKQIL